MFFTKSVKNIIYREVIVLKKCLTMWQVWAGIAVVLAVMLILKNSFSAILPFAIFLICPLMMIFMMKDHKH